MTVPPAKAIWKAVVITGAITGAVVILLPHDSSAGGIDAPRCAGVGDAASNAWEKIKEAFVALWDLICTVAPVVWNWIKGVAGDVWESIQAGFGGLWSGLVDFPVKRAFVPVLRQSAAAGLVFGIVFFSIPANPRKRSPGGPIFMFFVAVGAGVIVGLAGAWFGLVPVIFDVERPTIHNVGALPVVFERLDLTSAADSVPIANYFIFPVVLLVIAALLALVVVGGGALVGRIAGAWLRRRVVKSGEPAQLPIDDAIAAGGLFAGILAIIMVPTGVTVLAIHYDSPFWAWIPVALLDVIGLIALPFALFSDV